MSLLTYIYRIFRPEGCEGHYSAAFPFANYTRIFSRHLSDSRVLEWR